MLRVSAIAGPLPDWSACRASAIARPYQTRTHAASDGNRGPRASAIARPTIGGTMSERPRAGVSLRIPSFAKSDDDVGLLARDARAAKLRQKL